MSKEEQGESGSRVVLSAAEEIPRNFVTIVTPSITTTLKYDFMFGCFLLLYKLSGGEYELECYTGSGVRNI